MAGDTPETGDDPLAAAELVLKHVGHELAEVEHDLEAARKRERELVLKVGTPKGSFTAIFERKVTVSEVIRAAIDEKKLEGGVDAFELFFGETLLTPIDREVISFGVKSGDTLLLAATGSGV